MRVAPFLFALLLLASGASAQSLVGITSCCPNEVVTVDAATGDTTTVATIGTGSDAFIATVGSLVLDVTGGRAYMVRNGRVAWIDLATGAVTVGREASDWIQLAGVDAARGRLYAFATERDTLDRAENQIFRNYLVAYDLATEDTTRLAQIGEYTILNGTPSGDTFSTVTGPAAASADALYTIRNGRLVSVDLASGAVAVGTEALELPEVIGTDGTWLYRTERAVTGLDTLQTYTARLLRQPLASGVNATPDTLSVFGSATIDSRTGRIDGDSYLASFGIAFYDATGDRVLLNRSGQLVEVSLSSPSARVLGPSGRIRYVPSAASVSTAAESTPDADLRVTASPNPASGPITVSLALTSPEAVTVEIVDTLGRRVALVHEGPLAAGTLTWQPDVAPGVYLLRARTASGVRSVPVTIVR